MAGPAAATSRKVVCVLTVLAGLTSTAIREALGSISRSNSSRFAVNSVFRRLTPVRPREAGDKTVLDRVVRHAEHDGDRRRCILGRKCCGEASGCDDHRDLPANKLGRKVGESLHLLGPAVVDRHVLALDIAGFFEALAKSAQPLGNHFRRSDLEKPDHRHRRLLRARRERPRRRHAAERSYHFPPSDSDRHVALPCEGWLVKATISRRKRAVFRSKIAGSDRSVRRCGLGNSAGIDGSLAILYPG